MLAVLGPAVCRALVPPLESSIQSLYLGAHTRDILLISRPAYGRKLNRHKHNVGQQLVHDCLHVDRMNIELASQP